MNYIVDKKIAILMATYNGARYLKAQLDSILWQTNNDWELFIHDDCSTDNTVEIIKEYAVKYDNIHLVYDNIKKGRGSKLSFMYLLEHVEADYYMFSDQDDLWLPGKIQVVYERIVQEEKITPDLPLFVYTDKSVADQNCFVTHKSRWEVGKMTSKWFDSIDAYLVKCKVGGCTAILNAKAKEVALPIHPNAFMHDWWVALMVLKNGGRCISIAKSTMLYRQHSSNVCGIKSQETKYFTNKFSNIANVIKGNISQYKFMNEVTGCSKKQYIVAKLYVVFYRLFS